MKKWALCTMLLAAVIFSFSLPMEAFAANDAGGVVLAAQGNPCGAKAKNPCAGNPCAGKATNPCAGNPCGAKAKNPCAGNPCAGKK